MRPPTSRRHTVERSSVAEETREVIGASAAEQRLAVAGARRHRETVRMAVVGVSTSRTCGVRDHATLLAEAMSSENVSCSVYWLYRSQDTIRATRSEIRSWMRRLAAELEKDQPDVVLLHYSVFSYSYRGIPLFVRPTLRALESLRVPLITVLHEFAYPWRRAGLHGTAWALSHRALLIEVMRASTAVVVTIDERADWLASRVWLPRRPAAFAPVFSTLPPPAVEPRPDRESPVIGLFGYSHEEVVISLVVDALGLLEDRGRGVRLMLLGAPGRSSPVAEAWLEAARTRGIAHALSFSGTLAAQDLSDALAACDIMLFVETPGPTSRKTTLAASLASGRALVAIDGPHSWPELIQAQAVHVVQRTSSALALGIETLLDDEGVRQVLGARGQAFAERQMGVARSARVVAGLLDDVLNGDPS
jgi:glycosyltransferase involved in cell wall biosynthesis